MNVNSGRNTFNAVTRLDGPKNSIDAEYIGAEQKYDLIFDYTVTDQATFRTINHGSGALGTNAFVSSESVDKFDFEIMNIVADLTPVNPEGPLRIKFFTDVVNAGPILSMRVKFNDLQLILDREVDTINGGFIYRTRGQMTELVEIIKAQIASPTTAIVFAVKPYSVDVTNGWAITTVI